jgi:c-di-GMP-binding flagellar brake protein YcgR
MRHTAADPDRRESVRVQKSISVQFKKGLRSAKQRWISTTLRDISETGICISTNTSLPPASYIRLRLKIPTERDWLLITGRAIKSDKRESNYLTHVRLLQLDMKQKKDIRTYIAWVLVKEGGTV